MRTREIVYLPLPLLPISEKKPGPFPDIFAAAQKHQQPNKGLYKPFSMDEKNRKI